MATRVRRRSRARRGEGDRLRTEIIDATEALLLQTQDADAVSVRAVATAVGITPPSIYMHFMDKDELILAVCERNFQAFSAVIEEAMRAVKDPVAAVKAMGRAYVAFGLEHPEQYRLLFMARAPEQAEAMMERIGDLSGFTRVVEGAQRCIDEGRFHADDAFTVACGLWMNVHGITSLLISKPTFPWPDREALVEHGIEAYCRGLEAPVEKPAKKRSRSR